MAASTRDEKITVKSLDEKTIAKESKADSVHDPYRLTKPIIQAAFVDPKRMIQKKEEEDKVLQEYVSLKESLIFAQSMQRSKLQSTLQAGKQVSANNGEIKLASLAKKPDLQPDLLSFFVETLERVTEEEELKLKEAKEDKVDTSKARTFKASSAKLLGASSPSVYLPSDYVWKKQANIWSYVKTVSWAEWYSPTTIFGYANTGALFLAQHEIIGNRIWPRYESFSEIPKIQIAAKYPNWQSDEMFGLQRMQGLLPNQFIKVKSPSQLPQDFDIPPSWVEQNQALFYAGNVYLIDYSSLAKIKLEDADRYVSAPYALFVYQDSEINPPKSLMPLFIQLWPSKNSPVYTPTDTPSRWNYAKFAFASAEFQFHEIREHLNNTHLLMEVFIVATHRCLPATHPIYRLLLPHFERTLAVNSLARSQLIPLIQSQLSGLGSSGVTRFLQNSVEEYDFFARKPKTYMQARGIDLETLPNYFYGADSLKSWEILYQLVDRVLAPWLNFPNTDSYLTRLNEWSKEIKEEGMLTSFLPQFQSYGPAEHEQVVEGVTQIIWTSSVYHSAINDLQGEYLGYVLNFPGSLAEPVPVKDDLGQVESKWSDFFLDSVPARKASKVQSALSYALINPPSSYLDPTLYQSIEATAKSFDETEAPPFNQALLQLTALGNEIQKRNIGRPIPYAATNPVEVTRSVIR